MGVISVPKSPSPRVPVPCPHDPKGAEQNSAQKNSVPIWKGVRELENNSVTFCSLPCHCHFLLARHPLFAPLSRPEGSWVRLREIQTLASGHVESLVFRDEVDLASALRRVGP